jgi:hypothetical protein
MDCKARVFLNGILLDVKSLARVCDSVAERSFFRSFSPVLMQKMVMKMLAIHYMLQDIYANLSQN